jgi:hypothetical protein
MNLKVISVTSHLTSYCSRKGMADLIPQKETSESGTPLSPLSILLGRGGGFDP